MQNQSEANNLLDKYDRLVREVQRYYRLHKIDPPGQLNMKFQSIRTDIVSSWGIDEKPVKKVTKAEALQKIKDQLSLVGKMVTDDPSFAAEEEKARKMIDVFTQFYHQNPEKLLEKQQAKEAAEAKKKEPTLFGDNVSS